MAFNKDFFDSIHSSIINDVELEKINDKASWPIFCYDWINMTPNTEAGLKPANSSLERNHFYQWDEIINGNQSVFITPTNATTLTKVQGTGDVDDKGHVDGSYYDVKYSKKDSVVFYGIKTDINGGVNFGTTSFGGFGDFTTVSDQESVQFITTQKVSKELLTKFFYIPDVAQIVENNNAGQYDQDFNDNDIFYIESYTNHFDPNTQEFVYSEITFNNLGKNMAQSGQIIEQHVYLSSPGAGYLVPKILFDENGKPIGKENGWDWNTEYTPDRGVKTIQMESTGNFAIAGLEVWGYPVDRNHNTSNDKRWYAPRKLLVENFRLPLEENFYKVSPDNSTYDIIDGQIEATADLQSYKMMIKDYASDKPLDYQLILGSTKSSVDNANDKGVRINDVNFGFKDDFVDNSKSISDPTKKNEDLTQINVRPSSWFFGNNKYPNVSLGQETINLKNVHKNLLADGKTQSEYHSAKDMLNLMSFALNPVNRLPLEINSKLSWSTADLPGMGGWVNKLLFGMNPQWRTAISSTDKLMPNLQTLPMLISRDLNKLARSSAYISNSVNKNNATFAWDITNLGNNWSNDNITKIPGYFFQRDESDALGSILSNKSNSTAITFTLTDKLCTPKYELKTGNKLDGMENISTVMLDQENNGNTYKVSDTSYSIAGLEADDNIITDVNGDTYIITNIGIKGIGDGDIRITCFNTDIDSIGANDDYHDYICFQTYMKSTAAYKNGQIREWFSDLNVSYLDFLDKFTNHKFDWPKQLPQPKPFDYENNIDVKVDNCPAMVVFGNYKRNPTTFPPIDGYTTGPQIPYDFKKYGKEHNLTIKLLDFKDYGLNNVDDIKKKYKYIKIKSLDNLNFSISKAFSGANSRELGSPRDWSTTYDPIPNSPKAWWAGQVDGQPMMTPFEYYTMEVDYDGRENSFDKDFIELDPRKSKSFTKSFSLNDKLEIADISDFENAEWKTLYTMEDDDINYLNSHFRYTLNASYLTIGNRPFKFEFDLRIPRMYVKYALYFDDTQLMLSIMIDGDDTAWINDSGYDQVRNTIAATAMLGQIWYIGKGDVKQSTINKKVLMNNPVVMGSEIWHMDPNGGSSINIADSDGLWSIIATITQN